MDPFKTQQILEQCIQNYNALGLKSAMLVKKLTEVKKIIEKEKKRLGISHPRITMEEIGFQEIKSQNNLYNLVKHNDVKITKICSNTHNKVTIGLRANTPTTITLEAGTMLFPDEPLADNTQTLILRDDLSTTVSSEESEF